MTKAEQKRQRKLSLQRRNIACVAIRCMVEALRNLDEHNCFGDEAKPQLAKVYCWADEACDATHPEVTSTMAKQFMEVGKRICGIRDKHLA